MAANQLSEQEIQFRKRARRRLVGAVALVLLMVTVLPMVLDDREAKSPPQDIAISIPSQEGGSFTSRIVPVAPQSVSDPMPSAPVELAPPLEQPKAATQEVSKADTPPAKPESVRQVQVVPESKVQSVPKAAEATTKPVDGASSAKPAVVSKAPVAVAKVPVKKGAFTVQVGVFSEGPKLTQLESKLTAQGFHISKEKLDTSKGAKIRLRTGTFTTRSDAEVTLGKLKDAGVAGMIVTK